MELKLFTSESVSEGHPDKICDQISDAILDAVLTQDANSRVACETLVTTQKVIVAGEIRTKAKVNYEEIVRSTLCDIGYTDEELGINCDTCQIEILLHEQSDDIALGVDATTNNHHEIGAGDQGIMFGYACNQTKGYMPLPIVIAHKLVRIASKKRKDGEFKWARPDMKSQVTIDYTDKNYPKVHTVLMSIQHDEDYDEALFIDYIKTAIIAPVLASFEIDSSKYEVIINPTGRFIIGGPHGDSGLTGRKIMVDSYGGYSRHGGGAFSGKDATKVDRSAAYMARYIAKNLVAANYCSECELQLSYAIGMSEPISIYIDTFNTNKLDESRILAIIKEVYDLTPGAIIKHLGLDKPIFFKTSMYGHFGRAEFAWEKLDMVDRLKKYL